MAKLTFPHSLSNVVGRHRLYKHLSYKLLFDCDLLAYLFYTYILDLTYLAPECLVRFKFCFKRRRLNLPGLSFLH